MATVHAGAPPGFVTPSVASGSPRAGVLGVRARARDATHLEVTGTLPTARVADMDAADMLSEVGVGAARCARCVMAGDPHGARVRTFFTAEGDIHLSPAISPTRVGRRSTSPEPSISSDRTHRERSIRVLDAHWLEKHSSANLQIPNGRSRG